MLPNVTESDIKRLIPDASEIAAAGKGGQKRVFQAVIDGERYAVKFMLIPESDPDGARSEAEARARREINIMARCKSKHLVQLGPHPLRVGEVSDQSVLYFTEEFIDGIDLHTLTQGDDVLPPMEVIRLGLEMTDAIGVLWSEGMIHRDIKPQNIMCRSEDATFVLLDAGYAFDIFDESLSQGLPVGTLPFMPPERFDYANRRMGVDFRSDMYSLGVTMYQVATGKSPFWESGDGSHHILKRILDGRVPPPRSINGDIPPKLDAVIRRMLGKSPHLRYRKLEKLREALESAEADI